MDVNGYYVDVNGLDIQLDPLSSNPFPSLEYGAEWEEISSDEPRSHWVCAVCVLWKAFVPAGCQHIQDHLAKIHQITDPANSTRRVVPISELVAQQKRDLTVTEKAEMRSKRCRKALLDWFA